MAGEPVTLISVLLNSIAPAAAAAVKQFKAPISFSFVLQQDGKGFALSICGEEHQRCNLDIQMGNIVKADATDIPPLKIAIGEC